ncbi:MAG: urease accessory protein UreF [Lachnospiraceae bacterium]
MYEGISRYLQLQQIFAATFPIGSFSHSGGLETFVQEREVYDALTLGDYMYGYLQNVLRHFEGPAFCQAYEWGLVRDTSEVLRLDEQITAMKLSRESRQASLKTGKAFLRLVGQMPVSESYSRYCEQVQQETCYGNYCIAAGFLCANWGLDKRQSVASFLFASLNNMVQTGVKCIPLGQTQGQQVLHAMLEEITKTVEQLCEAAMPQITNFAPMSDIASMQHERLYSRLYMS